MRKHRGAVVTVACIAALALVPQPADAQAVPAPTPTPTAIPSPPPVAGGMLGDFGGARGRLADRGITLRGHIVAESAANATGLQTGTAFASEIMIGADIDFGRLGHNDAGILHVTFTAREGSSLSSNAIGNVFTVQEIYGSGLTPRLTEASYEIPLANKHVDLLLGRVITENDFGASPTYWGGNLYCSYQSNAICGTPIAVPINSGYDAYPQSVWGARLKVLPTPNWYVEAGAYQVNPVYGERGNGFNVGFNGTTGTYLPFETGVTSIGGDGVARGSLRAGGYFDTSNATGVESQGGRFATPGVPAPVLPAAFVRGRYGYWVQADALVAGRAGPGERGTAIFAAYNYGDARTALLTNFADAGIVQHGTFHGRDNDTLSLGYAYGNINSNLRALEQSLNAAGVPVPVNGQEQIAEVNYGIQMRPWLSLRPGVQYVWRPSGNAAIRNALVFDLSTAINF